MYNNKIKKEGLTPEVKIPDFIKAFPHVELCEKDNLRLSNNVCGIKNIVKVDINITIKSNDKINSKNGCILNLIGFKNIEITYISDNGDNKVHKAKYNIPFSTHINYFSNEIEIEKIYTAVKELNLKLINSRYIEVSSKIFISPLLKSDKPITTNNNSLMVAPKGNYGNDLVLALKLLAVIILLFRFRNGYPYI